MATVQSSWSQVVLPINVRVTISGATRPDIYCTSISIGAGTQGSSATLYAPGLDWDQKQGLVGRRVVVFAQYSGQAEQIVFVGVVAAPSSTASENDASFGAVSYLQLADKVFLGQEIADRYGLRVKYPQRAIFKGESQETGWSVRTILRDIFSGNAPSWKGGGGTLPSDYRSELDLGNLSVLGSDYNNIKLGDITWEGASLQDALGDLLDQIGTVSFREEFAIAKSKLIVFELADPSLQAKTISVAMAGQSAAGTNVLDINAEGTILDSRNRIIGLGAPRKFVVSTSTRYTPAPLEKMWNPALEASVLKNPESTKAGNEVPGDGTRGEYSPEKQKVFRDYRLPKVLRDRIIAKDNAITLSDGTTLGIQVWKWGRTMAYNAGTGQWVGTESETPVLLDGVEWNLEAGTFRLKQPAINIVSSSLNDQYQPVDVMVGADVGITITYEGDRLIRDTGASKQNFEVEGLDNAGLAEPFINGNFAFRQVTNIGFPLDDDGGDVVFDDVWVFLPASPGEWINYQAAEVLQDDLPALIAYTDAALREKSGLKTTYSITFPYFTTAYRIGDRIQILGQRDFDFGTHQVLGITHDLSNDHSTTISTDNRVPLVASKLLE
jgi:hypothetical protein